MSVTGHSHQGAIVPDIPLGLPEGARVEFVLADSCEANRQEANSPKRRQGGWLKGQIHIAEDFDELPSDIADAFGMNS
jgi:hypothetical protein